MNKIKKFVICLIAGSAGMTPVETSAMSNEPDEPVIAKMSKISVVRNETVNNQSEKEEHIFDAVEQQPEFPGGQAAMMKWIGNNMIYPEAAQQNYIQGKVIVKAVIEKDGSISNVKVVKGVDKDLDHEAVRVVQGMPKWTAGKMNGIPVRCYFLLPITFKLP